MRSRDRRFKTYPTYRAYGVTWKRFRRLDGDMQWTCRRPIHRVSIFRHHREGGRYHIICGEHATIAATSRLWRAFRIAACHMGYCK